MSLSISASNLEPYGEAISREQLRFDRDGIIGRIWKHDPTVWKTEDVEISNRLGWLEAPAAAVLFLEEAESFAAEIKNACFSRVLLCGMGGSSLAPEVFSRIFGPPEDGLSLEVLDSTDPAAVLRCARTLPEGKTLFLISSKSGTTLETASFMNYFHARTRERLGPAPAAASFAAITDPGSFLESEARRLGFRRIFPGNPDIGGRFSVFSPFGLVPAALLGLPLRAFLSEAREAVGTCRRLRAGENPGANLGIILGTLARAGRDKAVFLMSAPLQDFGAWVEQLLAESTGKEGQGILPIVRPTAAPSSQPAGDRLTVAIGLAGDAALAESVNKARERGEPVISMTLEDPIELGAQFFLWEFATAVAGTVLGINPFDQPNVALSKKKTEAALNVFMKSRTFPEESSTWEEETLAFYGEKREVGLRSGFRTLFNKFRDGGYAAIQAFLPPSPETTEALRTLAGRIETRTGRPVVFDYGPRFLHSTGQLHKGDGGAGIFIQLTGVHPKDTAVPSSPEGGGSAYSFGNLIDAQALGDRQALREKGRPVARIHFKRDPVEGISKAVERLF
ncbi:MAG: glucose-6-phosphate isomerase [Acidobacteria bacterium]|nr:glucose-6-phosphate isomerase [Acidobacteriota bacterium]